MDTYKSSPIHSPESPFPVTVIVRGYVNEPVRLIAYSADRTHVVVGGGDRAKAIGFRIADVFEFEEELFADLGSAYSAGDGGALKALWGRARPLARKTTSLQ
jgi:hypothetical protein